MKKLINLLAGITLITTTTSNVIACDKTDQHGPSDQDQVNSIIAKMKKRHITVAAGSNTLVNNRDTMQQINKALQDLNALSASDVRAISYINPPILKAGKSVDVEASIKVGQYTKTILIHVTLAETIAQQVEAFQEKFNSSVVNTIAATPTKQGASETSTDINDYIVALQRSLLVNNPNPGVTDDDLAKIIAYGSPPLILGQVVNVTANFSFTNSIGQTIAGQLTFLVQRAQTPEEKARAIANKIITRSFDVDASTTESQVQTKLQTALRSANNTLTDADVNKFVWPNRFNLIGGFARIINLTIKINNVTVVVPLTITKKTSAEAQAQILANRIPPTTKNYLNAVNVSVDDLQGSGPTYDASNPDVTKAINRGLQTLSNNVITANDIKNISYTGNLVAGATELINGFIRWTDPASGLTGTKTFTVWVEAANIALTKAKALQDKINDRSYELGLVPDLNVSHVGTTEQVRKVIQKDNDLTDAETKAITFKPQTLVPGTTVPVAMELYDSVLYRGFRIVPIEVKIFQSAVQYVNNIKRAFDSSYRTGVNFILFRNSFLGQKASSPNVTAFLRQEIVADTANTRYAITLEMAQLIYFADVTLRSGTNLVGITIGSASQTFGVILHPQVDFRVSL